MCENAQGGMGCAELMSHHCNVRYNSSGETSSDFLLAENSESNQVGKCCSGKCSCLMGEEELFAYNEVSDVSLF